jgi:predicted RNA-binding protein with PUA-like domain
MARWLLKTEPSAYALADLVRDGRTRWDGVSNAQALGHLRAMRPGDELVVYHSGERRAVGTARVLAAEGARAPAPPAVEVGEARPFARPVPLAEIGRLAPFAGSALLRQGRLSVVPLTAPQWRALLRLGAAPARRVSRP